MNYQKYLETTYAAWLGKCIGVRLGAPVENWTSEKIKEVYGDKSGYLVDYDIFASDDDTNGPLFFIRPLLEKQEIDEKDISKAFLDYICEYHGFFWWGGVGVSSEHTAYENIKNGILAPASGSISKNGIVIAEQIGGQIFSDCWGYVSGFNPLQAKKLASMASSVTHDRNGIEGGIFVAVCTSLAYEYKDIHMVLNKALSYLDANLEYYKVVKDIIDYYTNNKENYLNCFEYIKDNYGYDKYAGVCHIIPNTAIMIMAMCYGENDFSKTLEMLNRCGWDTDCNCGNVGSIMGALVGLDGIDEKWIKPINDVVNCSSCVGYLNIQHISDNAKMFTDLAFKLAKIKAEEIPIFRLPYSYKGIRKKDGQIIIKDDAMIVDSRDIYKYTYYLKDDLFDARYDPEFSPLIYPNDELIIKIYSDEKQELIIYSEDILENINSEKYEVIGNVDLSHIVKANNNIHLIGIKSEKEYRIIDYEINRHPKIDYDFRNYPIDHYGPRYERDYMNNISGFVKHSGEWNISDKGLLGQSHEHALISSGAYGNKYHEIVWEFIPIEGFEHKLVFNMRDFGHYLAIGLGEKGLELIKKDFVERLIKKWDIKYEMGKKIILKLVNKNDNIILLWGEKSFSLNNVDKLIDLFGVYLGKNTKNLSIGLKIS